ncbi:CRAL/TRIO domain-containing protein [Exidia glandulosa HHB12029]|uniref:CRAL/TRIO domain-containing protein n=1 Tax=Exidia glandulosa HHB12029 TaxID=1314781 RepID=A0A165J662_EXIGL|nr:CRAL/TRIO domain-containing protein [Exidia glandulosa HHB12029]
MAASTTDAVQEPSASTSPTSPAALSLSALSGHVGHLDEHQTVQLAAFKAALVHEGLYRRRVARRRNTPPLPARAQVLAARRAHSSSAKRSVRIIDIKEFDETRRLYTHWTGRRDRRGVIRFVMPLCSIAPGRPNPESPIMQSNNIVDISNVGLHQFWNLRSHMQVASVVGLPSFFPTVWGWIKKWFDPITTNKIFILPSGKEEIFKELNQFIDAENIPTQYGGTLTYEFDEMPKMDMQLACVLRWAEGADTNPDGTKTFPIGPVLWERHEHTGAWEAIGVGGVDGAPRRVVVARLDEGAQMFGEEVTV